MAKPQRSTLLAALLLTWIAGPLAAQHSVARQWNEDLLEAIRNDFARPTVHARNLFHTSIAMWDAWAAYDATARPYLHREKAWPADAVGGARLPSRSRGRGRSRATDVDVEELRREAISYAAYRVLSARFADSPGGQRSQILFDERMIGLGYSPEFTSTLGSSPAALGNRIAQTVLAFGARDNSNEAGGYENRFYKPVNPALVPAGPGNLTLIDPNRWQPLSLRFFIDQSGIFIPRGFPSFLSPEWGQVTPFALQPSDLTIYNRDGFDYWVYHDPGPPPLLGTASEDYYKWGFEMVSIWSSHLDPSDGVMIDISPGAIGKSPLPRVEDYRSYYKFLEGGDSGMGHVANPATGRPYAPNLVPLGDYARVLAEFWADGPDSETPPGHWYAIANYVSDHPATVKRIAGQGPMVDALEWDVKLYLTLGGAMHDCAVAAWGAKGWYDYIRPVSALRYLARYQSSDPEAPRYDPSGIRLYPGKIEQVTEQTTAPGERHAHLAGEEGKVAVYAWRGPDFIERPRFDVAGVGWILAENWWPYQRPTFVTPPFAGYVSGHSTYSRAAAEVMTLFTGSRFFPGGLGEFLCRKDEFLVFEDGPSQDVTLQWATYQDASDQTSLSRIWGGIHPPADDLPGRVMGDVIGKDAFALATTYFGR